MKFAHLTDTHLNRNGKPTFLGSNSMGTFTQAIQYLKAEEPAFVLITGDVMHEGDTEDYRQLRCMVEEIEASLATKVILSLGNHDDRVAFYEGYLEEAPKAAYYESFLVEGLRVITLDSKRGLHDIQGHISAEQLEWLREELSQPAPLGSIVVFHHPPFLQGGMARHGLANSEDLMDVLLGSDVLGIFTGHTHTSTQSVLQNGTLSSTAGSTAFGMMLKEEGVAMTERCAFSVASLEQGCLSVSNHQVANERELACFTLEQMQSMNAKEFKPEDYTPKGAIL